MPIHSPPSGPKSLSFIERDSSILFLMSIADMHTAPYIPKEFFLIDPSKTPMSKCFKLVFAIKSSKNSSRPSPLIILEAKLIPFTLLNFILNKYYPVLLIMFLIACIP